jgi:hypothetical protein
MMSRPPLAGLRVLTVSQFGVGPFGTQVLAEIILEVTHPRFAALRAAGVLGDAGPEASAS